MLQHEGTDRRRKRRCHGDASREYIDRQPHRSRQGAPSFPFWRVHVMIYFSKELKAPETTCSLLISSHWHCGICSREFYCCDNRRKANNNANKYLTFATMQYFTVLCWEIVCLGVNLKCQLVLFQPKHIFHVWNQVVISLHFFRIPSLFQNDYI